VTVSPSLPGGVPGVSDRAFGAGVAVVTVSVMSFLIWLIYFNAGDPGHTAASSSLLPKVSAVLNGVSAAAVTAALAAVAKKKYRLHAGLMLFAIVASACFLANYVYYHLHHGDTPFTGTGTIRAVYFTILITHVLLSIVVLPLILTSVFLAVSRRFVVHRRLSRYTAAIWLYVSLSGVAIYAMLHA
jgi:putative membrane protein